MSAVRTKCFFWLQLQVTAAFELQLKKWHFTRCHSVPHSGYTAIRVALCVHTAVVFAHTAVVFCHAQQNEKLAAEPYAPAVQDHGGLWPPIWPCDGPP